MTAIDFKTISISDLAALVHTKFTQHNIKIVLVGGACVTIYSDNRYLSYDLDFVTYETRGKIKEALLELGFELKGKYFSRPDCPYFIEFVSPPVAVGAELVHNHQALHTPFGQIELLTPADCIKVWGRLDSFRTFDWKRLLSLAMLFSKFYQDASVKTWQTEKLFYTPQKTGQLPFNSEPKTALFG